MNTEQCIKRMTMGTWKARQMEKGRRASRSTGKSKGIGCSPLERTICRRNRSYKMRDYTTVMSYLTGDKRRKKGVKP